MMPSVEQMLEAAQTALRDFVVPNVDDQWAASALRSVDVILSHLQARTPVEGPMLHADTGDLAILLASASAALELADARSSDGTVIVDDLAAFARDAAATLAGYAAVADLALLNMRGRQLVDDLLLFCHARRDDGAAKAVHDDLRAYLMRHLERESAFFFPTYVGRPV